MNTIGSSVISVDDQKGDASSFSNVILGFGDSALSGLSVFRRS